MIQPASTGFQVQTRTGEAWDTNGDPVAGTSFLGVAAKGIGTASIHVQLTDNRDGECGRK